MQFNLFGRTFYFLANAGQFEKVINMIEHYFIKPEVLVLLIILVVYFEFRFAAFVLKKEKLRGALRKIAPWVYLMVILGLTVFNRTPGYREIRLRPDAVLAGSGNYHESSILTALFNILFYVPYGFLLYKWGKYKKPYITSALIAIVTAIGSEALQYLLARGVTTLEDVVLNTLGGCIGAALAAAIRCGSKKRRADNRGE